ncbi:MAG: hypothetical protein A2287_02080 [Candidatus Melainabacteria bacterium RIFOXYA12_FULL_32_12]|nr:MAG: hypothetical protein A2255_10600 [Candidatus Melainabacteria bacterium RIFOXYA2_FULL_32_9]OGI31534.1 MAG: hypothetical protein A2287_02080 [Candidatus Melainabacteria bacterium RIFOXYA12_FULL_32_12]
MCVKNVGKADIQKNYNLQPNNINQSVGAGQNGFLNFNGIGAGIPNTTTANNTAGAAYSLDNTSTFGNPGSNIFSLGRVNTSLDGALDSNPFLDNTFNQIDTFIQNIGAGMYPSEKTNTQTQTQAQTAPTGLAQAPLAQQGTAAGGINFQAILGMLQQLLSYLGGQGATQAAPTAAPAAAPQLQGNAAPTQKLSLQEGIAKFNQTGQPVWNKAECPVCHGAGCKHCSDSVPPTTGANNQPQVQAH